MAFINGKVPVAALRSVGAYKADVRVANAYDRLNAAAKKAGHTLTVINGYLSYAAQADLHAHPEKHNVLPAVAKRIAPAGESTHGLGTALDIIASTAAGTVWLRANAKRFGFTRTLLGINDTNHFQHNLKTAIGAPKDIVRKAITYANGQKLKGAKSSAAKNGVPGVVARSRIKQLAARDHLTGYPYPTLYYIYSLKA